DLSAALISNELSRPWSDRRSARRGGRIDDGHECRDGVTGGRPDRGERFDDPDVMRRRLHPSAVETSDERGGGGGGVGADASKRPRTSGTAGRAADFMAQSAGINCADDTGDGWVSRSSATRSGRNSAACGPILAIALVAISVAVNLRCG